MKIRPRHHAESGQIAAMLALLLPVLLALAGLVVDGGMMLIQYRRGQVTVDSAAIAAASQLDVDAFIQDNRVVLNPADAYSAALRYAQENGGGRVAITGIDITDTRASVSGAVITRTAFMRIFGVPQVSFRLASRAELTYGITDEGQ